MLDLVGSAFHPAYRSTKRALIGHSDVLRMQYGDRIHLGNIVCRRRFPADGAITHHVYAHWQVRSLRCDVDGTLAALQRIYESSPTPR
jgi:hypothetical protein